MQGTGICVPFEKFAITHVGFRYSYMYRLVATGGGPSCIKNLKRYPSGTPCETVFELGSIVASEILTFCDIMDNYLQRRYLPICTL
jgi:hypothetical protein